MSNLMTTKKITKSIMQRLIQLTAVSPDTKHFMIHCTVYLAINNQLIRSDVL